ncbi:MAG: GTP 3',8-cyclase MoaA [Desulfarculus sp.]|jgi:cyclic pyranopterin phosphate synthase|nr:MAG: GTP 3',8-cyclase MoaA [Desulfarculus sp.]
MSRSSKIACQRLAPGPPATDRALQNTSDPLQHPTPCPGLADNHGRVVKTLRLSVTDRCNLRCFYCLPEAGFKAKPREDILTFEEILRLVRIFLRLKIIKVRLTGGEPLVRGGIVELVRELKRAQVPDLRLTTNGLRLSRMAEELFQAGVGRVNVSLDTLEPHKFHTITGGGRLSRVLDGIEKALAAGFAPVKINVVVMRGVNDNEIQSLARLAWSRPLQVRFIEFMPIGRNGWRRELFYPGSEIMARLHQMGTLQELPHEPGDGPARRFHLTGWGGEVGLISPVSQHFCDRCDRLRLTADGKLLNCLFARGEVDIKKLLRSDADDEMLLAQIQRVVATKAAVGPPACGQGNERGRPMTAVGG